MTDKTINKELYGNKLRVLNRALRSSGVDGWVEDIDEDNATFIYESYTRDNDYNYTYKTYKASYEFNANYTSANITEGSEVVFKETYEDVTEDTVTKSWIVDFFTKNFGGSSKEVNNPEGLPVIKQFTDEEMIAIEPLYIEPDGVDGHGWTASADVLRSMTESCNKAIQEGRLLSKYNHEHETEDFYFLKAWINECDCYIGDHFVPEGQPLIKSQFTDKEAWDKRKSGEIGGVSIGAKGVWEEIDD